MIAREDARAIVYALDPERVAREVWRAAVGAPEDHDAAVVLDLATGEVRSATWPGADVACVPEGCVVIGWILAHTRDLTRARYAPPGTALPPSAELIEEEVARRGWRDVTWLSSDHWRLIEAQLDAHYEEAA